MTPPDRPAVSPAVPALGGHPGPVIVIADHAAVAQRALVWANAIPARGRLHRVRLISHAAGDIDGLAAEAIDLKATAVLAAGGEAARRAGQAVATRLGLPLSIDGDGEPAFPDR